MNAALEKASQWADNSGLTISPEKTVIVLFTNNLRTKPQGQNKRADNPTLRASNISRHDSRQKTHLETSHRKQNKSSAKKTLQNQTGHDKTMGAKT